MSLKRCLVLALSLGLAAGVDARDGDLTKLPTDQAHWDRLISSVKDVPEENLLIHRSPNSSVIASERFYVAEAECSANAVALLNVNDLLPDAPKTVRVGTNAAWSGKTVVFLFRSYADGRDFLFACLVDNDGKLERTRLLRPELRDKKFAIEIDAAKYSYAGK